VACQLSITPRRAGSIIKVEVSGLIGYATTPPVTVALFKDDAANSVAASNNWHDSLYGGAGLWLIYETKNNALTAIKLMVRYGVPSGGSAYMNRNDSAAATYGTALPPFTVQITEYDVDI
jgi:hypothetical protein